MSSNVQLDPFVAQAQNDNVAPLKKVEGADYDSTNTRGPEAYYANLIHW